jgi:hypothetical protein
MDNADRKLLIKELIEKIELYPRQNLSGQWIKTIHFRFPMYYNDNNEASCAVCFDLNGNFLPKKSNDESVVTLSKGEVDCETVKVEFSLEEFDMASIVNDPTYPKIKEYVLEHTGLKVSSLYIAQVKKKCGLEVGECYNKPKSENSKTSVCPPEKEQAIMDAFRYFGMI